VIAGEKHDGDYEDHVTEWRLSRPLIAPVSAAGVHVDDRIAKNHHSVAVEWKVRPSAAATHFSESSWNNSQYTSRVAAYIFTSAQRKLYALFQNSSGVLS